MLRLAVPTGLTDAFTALSSAFTFVTDNPVLGLLIFTLVAGTLIGIVFSLFRR